MGRVYGRYRDDIRRAFTLYALIPVIVIALSSYALSFSILYKTIANRNASINVRASEALSSVISRYQEKAQSLFESAAVLDSLASGEGGIKAYAELYDFVNANLLRADFFVFDANLQPIIASSNFIPEYAQSANSLGWGIMRSLKSAPDYTILSRQSSIQADDTSLAIGRAIVQNGNVLGYGVFDMDEQGLVRLISNTYSTSTVVTDSFGYVLAHTNELLVDSFGKLLVGFRDESGIVKSEADSHYVTRSAILDGSLYVYTFTSIGFYNSILLLVGVLLVLLFALLMLATSLLARKIAHGKTQVLDDIVRAIENVQAGKLDTRLELNTNNEFQVFAEAYNQMLSDIKNLIDVNKERALQMAVAEIKQLESQFDPHFLYNTLETIRYLVKMDPSSVDRIVVSLSELLRYSINHTVNEVRLDEDIAHTNNYLLIQKCRFGKNLQYEIHSEAETEDCIVPKLLIQPLIENSIKYGFADQPTLSIRVFTRQVEDKLEVVVEDDGSGITEDMQTKLNGIFRAGVNPTKHIGLYNVHRRVQLMYGKDYGVEIINGQLRGFLIRIVLPAARRSDAC
ncbi:sensor histidine kinase [Cohnella fermenti]|uniref:HAMP domain-containing protein n=1 Tax=Cohnella fermenti TaxID=2565925 RepID=A0A4S4BYP3_9BACL|nr:sensor histidine kinase [Cohnella fermenti]THF80368.1 hypothetical protein E6C55_10830 [Cohnella fermenti]